MLRVGFEPTSVARKATMIGRTTPPERFAYIVSPVHHGTLPPTGATILNVSISVGAETETTHPPCWMIGELACVACGTPIVPNPMLELNQHRPATVG